MTTKKKIAMLIAGLLLTLIFSGVALGERWVVVNGFRLNPAQIQYLDSVACGLIPDGRYWLNLNTGIWGYAGNSRPMGHISDNCNRRQRRPSLSERGMLFSPHDWTR